VGFRVAHSRMTPVPPTNSDITDTRGSERSSKSGISLTGERRSGAALRQLVAPQFPKHSQAVPRLTQLHVEGA
jgi:hypothetical protein